MTTFPAISLHQPYASLLAIGAKPFETRHWRPPFHLIGHRIAIHASKRRPTLAEWREMDERASDAFGFCHWHLRIPYGAIVCTAIIDGVYEVRERFTNGDARLELGRIIKDDGFGDYSVGRFCWEMTGVDAVDPPAPEIGRQKWWPWNDGRGSA